MTEDLLVLAPLFLFAIPIAMVLHELTHFLVARLLGVPATIVVSIRRPMFVRYGDGERAPSRQERLAVELAPLYVGLVSASVWIATAGFPAPSAITLVVSLAWIDYTLVESAKDVGVIDVPEHVTTGWNRDFLRLVAALGLASFIHATPYARNPYVVRYLVVPIVLGGVAVALLGVIREARSDEGVEPGV